MESLKIGRLAGPGTVLRATRRRDQIERIGSQRSDASLAVASYPEYGIALLDAVRCSQVPTDSNLARDTTLLSLDVVIASLVYTDLESMPCSIGGALRGPQAVA